MTEPLFDTIAVVGLGLIGSSVARGLKTRGLARRVVGYDSSTQVHTRAKELGFCDSVAATPAEAVKDAELVLIAVPVGATADAVKSVAPHLRQGAILTEVGSVKAAVIRQVLAVLPKEAIFVPGHPIAGTEHSGPDAGFAELFDGRWAILTPCERSTAEAVEKVAKLW